MDPESLGRKPGHDGRSNQAPKGRQCGAKAQRVCPEHTGAGKTMAWGRVQRTVDASEVDVPMAGVVMARRGHHITGKL